LRYPGKFRFISKATPTTAGGAVNADYFVTSNPTSNDVLGSVANFSNPMPLFAGIQVEGVDYPFFTRYLEVTSYPDQQWNSWKKRFYTIIVNGQYTLGSNGPIILPPVDDSILHMFSLGTQVPLSNYADWQKKRAFNASKAWEDVPGSWIFSIPATTYSIPVCELLSEIQEHLLETPNGGASFTSGLWSVVEVLAYLNNRTSRFLMETGILQVRSTQAALSADPQYDLPANLIDLRRAAWTNGASTIGLSRMDSLQADLGYSSWETGSSATPNSYIQTPEQSLEIRLVPQPGVDATLDFIYVQDVPTITNDCSIMPIPDEWVMFIKWGVISDMLQKEGEANDPERAQFAEQRYKEGVEIARLYLGTNQ